MINKKIDFVDLAAGRDIIRNDINNAINKVIDNCNFILGEEVKHFEFELGKFLNAKNVITCANGTDALQLVLMAEEIGLGDAVFVPAFTFISTVEVVVLSGATPIFVDVLEDTFNLDPVSLERAINVAALNKLNPKMVISVDLFGQPADINSIKDIARKNNMEVLSDAAQSLGAKLNNNHVGTLTKWTTTSFFPAKPLGCYGDGGAIITDDDDSSILLHSIRNHGQGKDRYDNVRVGLNSRLDTLQAAVLLEKLKIFGDELSKRNKVADVYTNELSEYVTTPKLMKGTYCSWAQYTIKINKRDGLRKELLKKGIPTAVYYPLPVCRQESYQKYPVVKGEVPVTDKISELVVSLPMHPYLSESVQGFIIEEIIKYCKSK